MPGPDRFKEYVQAFIRAADLASQTRFETAVEDLNGPLFRERQIIIDLSGENDDARNRIKKFIIEKTPNEMLFRIQFA